MRHRRLANFSSAGLQALPKPVTTDVHAALMYANNLVFSRLLGLTETVAEPEPTASPTPVPTPRAVSPQPVCTPLVTVSTAEMSTQVWMYTTEDKGIMTIPTPTPSPPLPEPPKTPPKDTVEIGLQAPDPPIETTEIVINSPGICRGKSRKQKKRLKGISTEVKTDWEDKQRRIEELMAQKETLELMEKEKQEQEKAALKAKLLQERKEQLIAKHQAAEEERLKRHLQWKATASTRKNGEASQPLHERLEANYRTVELKEKQDYELELQKVKERMRRVEVQEIVEHQHRYLSSKDTCDSERKHMRFRQLSAIRKANREQNYFQSPLLAAGIQEQVEEEAKKEQRSRHAKEILKKQKMYAELVKEIHRPISFVTPRTPRLKWSKPRPIASESPLFRRPLVSSRTPKPATNFELPQKSISDVSTVPRDYNTERRQALERSLLTATKSIDMFTYVESDDEIPEASGLQDKAALLERKAKAQERLIHRLDQKPELQAQACDSVSALYLDSIKAKLRIVNSLYM